MDYNEVRFETKTFVIGVSGESLKKEKEERN